MLPRYYTVLFNRVTDAIRALDAGDISGARQLLVLGQQEAEEEYIMEPERAALEEAAAE